MASVLIYTVPNKPTNEQLKRAPDRCKFNFVIPSSLLDVFRVVFRAVFRLPLPNPDVARKPVSRS